MKTIKIKRLAAASSSPVLAEVSVRLDEAGGGHRIGTLNWSQFSYKPDVRFRIAYNDSDIFLKFYVKEKAVKAEKKEHNEMVCEDSCVEFFVSPADDGIYYNFEFNPIGTILLGSGHGRSDSRRADLKNINPVKTLTTLGREPFTEIKGTTDWTITVAIPLTSFFQHSIGELKGKKFRANFYKCGDKLTVPHYVTWNPVRTEKPDFHRPEHFGVLEFV